MSDGGLQDDLFSGFRWLVRRTSGGTTIRVRLEPLGRGLVRVQVYERRRPGEAAFVRRPEEEGRVAALAVLAPGEDYGRLFGEGERTEVGGRTGA